MNEEIAEAISPKLEALRAFIRSVAAVGQYLPDNATRANYREMYDDIKNTLNDPNLETYAPSLPHLGTTSYDATLWAQNQIRIVEGGMRLIAYLEAVLRQIPSTVHNQKLPLRCFLSYRFTEQGRQYATEVRHFLELVGVEVVTGERFEPRGVGEKIGELLSSGLHFGVLIVAEDAESIWTRDEVNRLWNDSKYVIVLVREGASFVQGLQGDLEWIPFAEGHIADAFSRMLEGIHFIQGRTGI